MTQAQFLMWVFFGFNGVLLGTTLLYKARAQEAREAFEDLVGLCEHAADFRNGNVEQGLDEGNVMAWNLIAKLKKKAGVKV